jgi:2-oxoglutarate dehydrogenase E1 component
MSNDVLFLANSMAFLDEVYANFRRDPSTVDPSWRRFFETGEAPPTPSPTNGAAARPTNGSNGATAAYATAFVGPDTLLFLAKVWRLVHYYRARGHLEADLDPLGIAKNVPHAELDPATYGFTATDLDREVPAGVFDDGGGQTTGAMTLREVIRRCRATYCRRVGVEFMHISSPVRKKWLTDRMEATQNEATLDNATLMTMLEKVARAELFERFVHAKYVGTKRFSLEGSETLVPLLDLMLEHAARQGTEEVVLGMAHRGRLNVLTNILGKKPSDIFAEFEDIDPGSTLGSGDVKYHLGYSTDYVSRGGKKMHLSLAFNPSHLEAIDPVVVGRVRGKQRRKKDVTHSKVLGILVHGDAAFAGQGLVAETLNLSEIHGYRTGGTLHVVVNNQIGFTATPAEARSTPYATDIAKMLQCPIFHVNGDYPEAVAHVVDMAMDYRQAFQCDVVIDMFCYRKYGHNEADEPSFTQPLMYKVIEHKDSVFKAYSQRLIDKGVTTQPFVDELVAAVNHDHESELKLAKATAKRPTVGAGQGVWQGYHGGPDAAVPDVDTGVARDQLEWIGLRATTIPDGFHAHPKIERLFRTRQQMVKGQTPMDWGCGEMLAIGSLVLEGNMVRLSGQDTGRGTFSSRHAIVVDVENGDEYLPLAHLTPDQADCRIYDSALSEAAVLGFEYGYSLDYPDALIAWEAQFGDFANGAQVVIDQFISSSEDKWKRISGLVMLLPHGFEGQGPEHSSARLERYLQLCAEDNIQVVYPSTPAQYFHVLRRQVHRKWRKPLIVMTPKSLLRLPAATSSASELSTGRFQRVLPDVDGPAPAGVERVFLCTGKVVYDLIDDRKKRGDQKSAIVRIEQLYPFHDEELARILAPYTGLKEIVWVQEEPINMGAYSFIEPRLRRLTAGKTFRVVARAESASPATGSYKAHNLEQRAILDEAFR